MQTLKENFHVAVPTAFNQDETLNVEATLEHTLYLKQQGVKSVLVSGSTGEQHSLSNDEKKLLIDKLDSVTDLKENFEVIFGISNIRQKRAEELARIVHNSDVVKGILVGFPPYIMPTQAEAITYFKKIVTLAGKSTIIYNNPGRTGFDLNEQSTIELLKMPQVVGLKEAGNPVKISRILSNFANSQADFSIYAGGEADLAHKVTLGFNRISSIWGNLYPQEISTWFEALQKDKKASLSNNVAKDMDSVKNQSILPYIKRQISEREKIAMGICRSPLGN